MGVRWFDDLLPDVGERARARGIATSRRALARASRFDRAAIGFEERTALDMLEAIARRELEFFEHRLDRFWAVNHLFSGHWISPSTLLPQIAALHAVNSDEGAERYLARLAAVPAYLRAVDAVIRDAAAAGATMPAVVIDRVLGQLDRLLCPPAARSPVLEPPAGRRDAIERAERLLAADVYPASRRGRRLPGAGASDGRALRPRG